MIIMGIDPGIATLGYGVVDFSKNKFTELCHGTVTTPPELRLGERLNMLYEGLDTLIKMWKPESAAIEELFFNTNVKTAIAVGHARGVAMLAAVRNGLSAFEYTPLQIKQAVAGYGRADKKQVMQMVKTILKLDKIPRPDDAADGLAIAICHAHSGSSLLQKYIK